MQAYLERALSYIGFLVATELFRDSLEVGSFE